MDRIVATEAQLLGESSSISYETLRDLDQVKLFVQDLEFVDRLPQATLIDPVHAARHGQCCTTFCVDQARRHDPICFDPEPGSDFASRLLDDHGHDCRSIKVNDQRRCSPTKSLTLPRLCTRRSGRVRFGWHAWMTSPPATARSNFRPPLIGIILAMALPLSVTTTSSPSRTRAK